jgi:hypothetical protein
LASATATSARTSAASSASTWSCDPAAPVARRCSACPRSKILLPKIVRRKEKSESESK